MGQDFYVFATFSAIIRIEIIEIIVCQRRNCNISHSVFGKDFGDGLSTVDQGPIYATPRAEKDLMGTQILHSQAPPVHFTPQKTGNVADTLSAITLF